MAQSQDPRCSGLPSRWTPGGLRQDSAPLETRKDGLRWTGVEGPSVEEGPPGARQAWGTVGPLGCRARFVGTGVEGEGR